MTAFVSLPEEILVEVMSNLDPFSLVRCTQTCRLLYKTYRNSPILQYTLELSINGMLDAAHLDVPIPERLARIRALRAAWCNLSFQGDSELALRMNNCTAHALVAGVLALVADDMLKVIWLPSVRDDLNDPTGTGGPRRSLEHRLEGITTSGDFGIDPTQDLLVYLENGPEDPSSQSGTWLGRVHIRTLSSNLPHPQAQAHPYLTFTAEQSTASIFKASFHIASDILALFIVPWYSRRRLLLWNWQDGTLLYDSGKTYPQDIKNFVLLNRSSFLLTSTLGTGRILVYTFPSSPSPSSSFPSSPFPSSPFPSSTATSTTTPPGPRLRATLHLPPLKPYKYISQFSVECAPLHALPPEGAMFFTPPCSDLGGLDLDEGLDVGLDLDKPKELDKGALLAFRISYSDLNVPHDSGHAFELFTYSRALLRYVRARSRVPSGDELEDGRDARDAKDVKDGAVQVDWKEWGEYNTRFLPVARAMPWGSNIHGHRVARQQVAYSSYLEILDFNTSRIFPSCIAPNTEYTICTAPSAAEPGVPGGESEIFKSPVITRLPYQTTRAEFAVPYHSYMIDEERVILVEVDSHVHDFVESVDVCWL